MKKIYFSAFLFFLLSSCLIAQNKNSADPLKKKEHYRVISNGNDDPQIVVKALYHSNLDTLRFVNERRRLPVLGTSLVLELYSGQELLDLYRKPVHPLNIANPLQAKKYALKLTDNGIIEAVPQK